MVTVGHLHRDADLQTLIDTGKEVHTRESSTIQVRGGKGLLDVYDRFEMLSCVAFSLQHNYLGWSSTKEC